MRLFRLMIYVENKENLTYIVSTTTTTTTKKTGYPHNRRYCFTRPQILRRHTQKKHNEKLVLICQPSLYPQPPGPGPEALDFASRLPWGRMVEDKKEQGF